MNVAALKIFTGGGGSTSVTICSFRASMAPANSIFYTTNWIK